MELEVKSISLLVLHASGLAYADGLLMDCRTAETNADFLSTNVLQSVKVRITFRAVLRFFFFPHYTVLKLSRCFLNCSKLLLGSYKQTCPICRVKQVNLQNRSGGFLEIFLFSFNIKLVRDLYKIIPWQTSSWNNSFFFIYGIMILQVKIQLPMNRKFFICTIWSSWEGSVILYSLHKVRATAFKINSAIQKIWNLN